MKDILVVDKPSGPTSHDICQIFKRKLKARKVGHAGTLDPLASGVLILLINEATKRQAEFMGANKEYLFTMKLGVTTDTYDCQGKVVEICSPERLVILSSSTALRVNSAKNPVVSLLSDFTGPILQTPPPFSALKKNGVPLYKLARKGVEVKPEPRKITIHSLEIVSEKFPEVTLKARCSSGTYIRSLAHDLGQRLGCGAHITALRRLRSEPFGIEDAVPVLNGM